MKKRLKQIEHIAGDKNIQDPEILLKTIKSFAVEFIIDQLKFKGNNIPVLNIYNKEFDKWINE